MRGVRGTLDGRLLLRFVLLMILVRLVRDTGVRIMYPFLPQYAAGLGITLTAMGMLLMLRNSMIVLSPYLGSLADRYGPRPLLIPGFILQGIGLLGFSYATGLWSAVIAIFVLGLSDTIVHPLLQGYVSEHSPPWKRGRVMGMVEYSWALTYIVVLPIVGWLIAGWGWQLPFRLLSLGSFFSMALFIFVLPPDVTRHHAAQTSLRRHVSAIVGDGSSRNTLIANAAIFAAAETFFVLWGTHLEINFNLGPARVGQIALFIGVAELGGSVISSLIIDRVGKRRGVLGGTLMFLLVLAFIPWLNQALWSLVLGLALIAICTEYTIVSTLPLLADQRPVSRTTMLAMGAMTAAIIRSGTDASVLWLFDNFGFVITVAYAAFALILAAWVLWRGVEERSDV